MTDGKRLKVAPDATDEEVAAIVAALDATTAGSVGGGEDDTPRWRWSGRWWTKPVPLGRNRPW